MPAHASEEHASTSVLHSASCGWPLGKWQRQSFASAGATAGTSAMACQPECTWTLESTRSLKTFKCVAVWELEAAHRWHLL